jgi:hypothetical protein
VVKYEIYPGLPSDVGKSKNGAFKYVKDIIWKKIQGWLQLILSVGGKEVLIKISGASNSSFPYVPF